MNLEERPNVGPVLVLDEMLNLAAARPLAEALASARGTDLALSVANVRHLGAQCGQLLLAGAKAWQADGHVFQIIDKTPEFDEGVRLLGLDPYLSDEEIVR